MRAYFVSDLHLKSSDDERTKVFVAWLARLTRAAQKTSEADGQAAGLEHAGQRDSVPPTHLFLVGDIFDLWIGGHEYFVKRFQTVVEAIQALRAAGVEVFFFEGNHDLHLKTYWQDQLGVEVHADAAYFELGQHLVRVEHGDLINPGDWGYKFLRAFLRTSVMRAVMLGLPSSIVSAIGERMSRVSRAFHATPEQSYGERIRRMVREHAERSLRERPFDLIVSGHLHVRDDHALSTQARSVNLGSWFERPYRALLVDDSRVEFVDVEG